jgi:hypothetical protein
MLVHRYTILAISIIAVVACNPFSRKRAVEIKEAEVPVGSRWNGTLATPSELAGALQVRGTAWMAPASGQTRAHVSIANAAPGGVHPWHVHRGGCGNNRTIFGPTDAYRPLQVDGDGNASSDADLPGEMPTAGEFSVNVHASSSNMGTIIACGNLAPPIR